MKLGEGTCPGEARGGTCPVDARGVEHVLLKLGRLNLSC